MVTKGEGDGVMVRGRGGEDVGGYGEKREERDSHYKSVKTFHDVSSTNLMIAPSVFVIFWGYINQIMVLYDGFQQISRGIRVKPTTPFFICVKD